MVRETLAQIASTEGIERRGLVLQLLTALKQVCNHPAQYLKQRGPLPGRSGNFAALDELLDIITAECDSVFVFSQYVGMCRLIESHLHDVADVLDADPFALLLVRGREREVVLAALRERRGAQPSAAGSERRTDSGILARDAYAAARAADALGTPAFEQLGRRTGISGRELLRRARAWRYGGVAGLTVLANAWPAAEEHVAEGCEVLGTGTRARDNRGSWDPAGPASADPASAAALLAIEDGGNAPEN